MQVLDVSSNRLTSVDTLADGCTALTELYIAGNVLPGLSSLKAKAPNLETLVSVGGRGYGVWGVEATLLLRMKYSA